MFTSPYHVRCAIPYTSSPANEKSVRLAELKEGQALKAGERIKQRRLALGMTQQQLADKVGVSKATVSQWESSEIKAIKGENLLMLGDVLRTDPGWLQAIGRGSRDVDMVAVDSAGRTFMVEVKPGGMVADDLSISRLERALQEVEEAAAMLGLSMSYHDKAQRIAERYRLASEPVSLNADDAKSASS